MTDHSIKSHPSNPQPKKVPENRTPAFHQFPEGHSNPDFTEFPDLDIRALSPRDVLQLQRTIGNQAVMRLLAGKTRDPKSNRPQSKQIEQSTPVIIPPPDNMLVALETRLPSAQRSAESGRALGQVPTITQHSDMGRIHRCPCCGTKEVDQGADAVEQEKPKEQPRREPELIEILEPPPKQRSLKETLVELGYEEDRNYMSFHAEDTAHVGWKAHVGATPEEGVAIIEKAGSVLRRLEVGHKFDMNFTKGSIQKFLTIYPPENENLWVTILQNLNVSLADMTFVKVEGELQMGRVSMRHGQNTPLTMDMVGDLSLKQEGTLGKFPRFTGKSVGTDLPLLYAGKKFFFSKTQDEPTELSPKAIYMAIRYNDMVIPDKREEPNPAKAPLPPGVEDYVRENFM